MAGETAKKSSTGLLLALAAGYFVLRNQQSAPASSAAVPAAGNTPAPTASAGSSSTTVQTSPSSTIQSIENTIKQAEQVGKVAVPVLAAGGAYLAPGAGTAVAVGVAGAAIALEAAGGYLGYEQGITVIGGQAGHDTGAVVGLLNPVLGNAVIAGANAGSSIVKDVGGNQAAQDAGAVGGGIIGVLITLGEFTAAAELLPTFALVAAIADLVGALLGVGTGDSAPPPPPTPQQQAQGLYLIAAGDNAALNVLGGAVSDGMRILAAEQLVQWANGPSEWTLDTPWGTQDLGLNPYRAVAKQFVMQLGLYAALK